VVPWVSSLRVCATRGFCQIRLDQVLDPHSKPSTVEVFRINNMLDFYSRMITRIMGHGASLPSLFSEYAHLP
jgi:hypothetical protein